MPSTRSRTFVRRWTGFVSAICLMQLSGTYGFSNYSTALKSVLGLTQSQLNRLSVAKDLGDSCGILAGILSNYLPAWALLCVGAAVGFVGYGIQWLVVSQIISPLPYWTMFIAALLAGNSVSWMNTATFTVSVRNFSRNRGPVVGLFKAYMGLSAAIFSRMCDYLFSSSSSKYLLMLVVVPPTFCIISAMFICPVPPADTEEEEREEKQSIFIFNSIACILAVYITIINLLPSEGIDWVLASGLMIIVAAPIFVPLYIFSRIKPASSLNGQYFAAEDQINGDETVSLEKQADESHDPDTDSLRETLLRISSSAEHLKTFSRAHKRCGCLQPLPELGEDRNTLQLFTSWDFYALYIALFCGAGSGMMFSNNLGQIGQSFGFTSVTIFSSFFSLGNFCGRIASGNGSEYFLRIIALPRPLWLGLAKLPMIAMFLWLSTGSKASLYVGTVVVGFCHGTLITLTIPTVSEFYGLRYFGTNFMVTNTHLLAGSSVFSGLLAGYLYDKQAEKEQGLRRWWLEEESSLTCYGSRCYGETLVILAGVMGVALFIDALLSWVSRPLYQKLQRINAHIFVHEKPTHNTIK